MGKGQRTIKSVVSKILKIFKIFNDVLCRFGLLYSFSNHRLSAGVACSIWLDQMKAYMAFILLLHPQPTPPETIYLPDRVWQQAR
jgi:hypothetical protein